MNRNWLLAHWRRILMQGVLCGVLAVTVGLAALTVHQKRLALRLPLPARPVHAGRLDVFPPVGWATTISDETSGGDAVGIDEILPDGLPGRRLIIYRSHASGMLSPLEHLLRTSYFTEADLAATGPKALRVSRLDVGGWPGVMVSRAIRPAGAGRVTKQLLACAVMPPAQAVVIRLDGSGAPDAADEELVRQMAETVVAYDGPGGPPRAESGRTVELGGGVFAPVPEHFRKLPADPNRTSRDLLADSYAGAWTSIELIPCVWLPGDGEEAFVSMLAVRDRDWISGPVKALGDGTWQVDRADGTTQFPSRAYCLTRGSDALIAVMHGGWREDLLFDAAWAEVAANVRFTSPRNIDALLQNGREQVERLVEDGADQALNPQAAEQYWWLWDQSENADQQFWMRWVWNPTDIPVGPAKKANVPPNDTPGDTDPDAVTLWKGSRDIRSDHSVVSRSLATILRLYGGDPASEGTHLEWYGTTDFTRYNLIADRNVTVNGQTPRRDTTQSWELRDGRLRNLLAGNATRPVPEQFIPGGWLPMVLGKFSDKPMVIRTESFITCDGARPGELLTLVVQRPASTSMPCVTVTVNGTGQISRWWYEPDGGLRYIDFAGGLRATRNNPRTPRR